MESNVFLNSEKFLIMVMLVRFNDSEFCWKNVYFVFVFFLIFDVSYLNLININCQKYIYNVYNYIGKL